MTGPLLAPPPVAPPRPAAAPAARKAAVVTPPNPGLAVLTYLRLHWLLILFCGSLIGAPAAYAAWTLLPGKYSSYALIQVESNPFAVAGSDPGHSGVAAFDTYVKTQKAMMRSALVLSAALRDHPISKLPTLAEQRDPVKYLEEKLEVEATGSELLRISMDGDRPDDVQKIVIAVTATYLKRQDEADKLRKGNLQAKVDGWRTDLDKLLTQRLGPAAPRGFQNGGTELGVVQAGNPAFGAKATADLPAVKQLLFVDARDAVTNLRREQKAVPARLAELKAEGEELTAQIELIKSAAVPQDVVDAVDKDPDVLALRGQAERLRAEYQSRRRSHPGGDASPAVREKKVRADEVAAEAETLKADKLNAWVVRTKRGEVGPLAERLKDVRKRFDLLQQRAKELPPQIEAALKELTENLPPEVLQASATKGLTVDPQQTDVMSINGLYAAIAHQAERLRLDLSALPRAREFQPASSPSLKDSKKQLMATVAAGLLGFALVGAGVVAVESRAKRVCSLADMTAASPAPVVGVVPAIPAAADPVGRAAAAEAMDRLRSRVTQTYLARGATTLAVTSPLADEGKAVTAYGLANSLALAGFKTLLLDFDLRTPALHLHAGVPNQDGLCELLLGQTDHRRAMFVLANGLHFIPAGAFSEEARAAAVGSRLAALIAALREPFDCVILHGHALLAAAEAVEVARRADAVLLCGAYRESRLPLIKRAVDRLAVMEVPHVGIVYLGATTHEALC